MSHNHIAQNLINSTASIHYGALHRQQAWALPRRSAVDLVAARMHDIDEAFASGEVATLQICQNWVGSHLSTNGNWLLTLEFTMGMLALQS